MITIDVERNIRYYNQKNVKANSSRYFHFLALGSFKKDEINTE